MRNSRSPPRPKQRPREYFRCAHCGPVADAHWASIDGGLTKQVWLKHGGQLLHADSVGQLRWLDRQACVACGIVRSQRCHRCNFGGSDTPLRELRVGDTFQDRRQPSGRRRASAMALPQCVVSRHATAWAESLEGAVSGHQCWALFCRYRCRLLLAEIPKGVDRNSELTKRLHLWETGKNQRSDMQGPGSAKLCAASQNSKRRVGTDRRTAQDASLCLDSPRIHQQSKKGLVSGAAHSSADCRRNWTAVVIPRIPPAWSAPRRPESPGVEGDTNWRGARRGSRDGVKQTSPRCLTSNCRQ